MSDASLIVRAHQVVVAYGATTVLEQVDVAVGAGEVWALLGPNGAGKTTLIECLEGFRRPNRGQVEVLGRDPWRAPPGWRALVGVVLQDCRIDADLSVAEYLQMHRAYYRQPRSLDDLLALVGLQHLASRRVHRLSGGERRRLDLAIALVGQPRLLFLDEPTTGFDPQARREVWEVIREHKASGATVVLTSHMLDEVEALADRVAILVDGQIRREGTVAHLRQTAHLPNVVSFATPAEALPRLTSVVSTRRDAATDRWHLRTYDPHTTVREIEALTNQGQVNVVDVAVRSPSFEDVYLDLLHHVQAEGGPAHA
ncbi:ABC-2 type transport system ATP-binding protein [Streptoalloteichus tenebrarius]|uniref:ABC-2 type transport system ATP-binding protein n=1 Tax=Streptoalloteichus tenebrarius (strain ATCC 17920 / DSM 40477 / JCM 4838 / CBS 697.72 / NBRC 16177 / NCIMB 11028 / NRRL B-12390 / A12253. 1 / ISP 5477) TaxID=1933 RepID=A0ABT1HTF6_STRSD|nr:ABC transporter ATP-binding protein [Streptoalloteichus tenebrarius]MCP2258810.1 ABC-2 type transport system ATP-binding protein [Streptoalloteichus tenebrarius]BFE99509.1 ABC transporter ATP-binding protein [Streptoalloteichus tenebrarius]